MHVFMAVRARQNPGVQVCLLLVCKFLNTWANSHTPAAVGLVGVAPLTEPPPVTAARRVIGEIVAMHQHPVELTKRMQNIAKIVSQINQLEQKNQGVFKPPLGGPEGPAGGAAGFAASAGHASGTVDGQNDALLMTAAPQPLAIQPLGEAAGDDGGGDGGAGSGGGAAAPGRLSSAAAAAAAAAGGESEKRRIHLENKRSYEAERRRRKAAEEETLREAAEKEAAVARGAPPPPSGNWRTPPELLPTLLSVWDFLGTFSDVLWLPPIPLARLDAALSPNTTSPEPCDEASEFVLRDVHCALLRTLEGRAGKGADVPVLPVLRSTRTNILPCVGDHHWQVWAFLPNVARLILSRGLLSCAFRRFLSSSFHQFPRNCGNCAAVASPLHFCVSLVPGLRGMLQYLFRGIYLSRGI